MRKFLLTILLSASFLLAFSSNALARTISVKRYYKPSTGSYVQSYYRSSPNSYKFDNYSSRGNYNPYTGKKGYKSW